MAGKITTNSVVLGDSITDTQNFVLKTNADGTATLARGALGALGTVFGVNGSSAITGATLVAPVLGAATATSIAVSGASTFTGTGKFATTIGVGNANPSASGSGITFPATQSASSDANTLDDYEEGTWTPTDASGASLSFSITKAIYTKIGNMVYAQGYVIYPATGSVATASIGGLPFTCGTNSYAACALVTSAAVVANLLVVSNSTTINPSTINTGLAISNATFSSTFLIFEAVYSTS